MWASCARSGLEDALRDLDNRVGFNVVFIVGVWGWAVRCPQRGFYVYTRLPLHALVCCGLTLGSL